MNQFFGSLPHMINPQDQEVFLSAGWMWPAYISRRTVWDLLRDLQAVPVTERRKLLEQALPRIYTPGKLSSALLELYQVVPVINEFAESIAEAIEAAMLGRNTAAVATLMPVVEGILRRIGELEGRNPSIQKDKLAAEIDHMVAFERARSYDKQTSDERVAMIEGFSKFFRNQLFLDTRKGTKVELNRPEVVHALVQGWGKPANFCVLLSIIDQLAFVLCMRTNGAPVLHPDDTPASRELAAHYLALQIVGKTRPPLASTGKRLGVEVVTRSKTAGRP